MKPRSAAVAWPAAGRVGDPHSALRRRRPSATASGSGLSSALARIVVTAPAFGYARYTSSNPAPHPLHRRSATGVTAWQRGQKITRS